MIAGVQANKISSASCQQVRVNGQQACRERHRMREESPAALHSGNNLFNLLLHLPATATHPGPHPVEHWGKAPRDGSGPELQDKGQEQD